MCSFSSPVPALQQVVKRCFPACRQFRIHFLWHKEATKAVQKKCSLLLPIRNFVVLAVGLAWGSHAVTKITITIQVKKNTNTSFPGEGHFCFHSKTRIVPTCILAFSGKGWQTGCRNEQLHVEGSRKNVTSLPKEAYHASVWLLKLDRASPRQCARQV